MGSITPIPYPIDGIIPPFLITKPYFVINRILNRWFFPYKQKPSVPFFKFFCKFPTSAVSAPVGIVQNPVMKQKIRIVRLIVAVGSAIDQKGGSAKITRSLTVIIDGKNNFGIIYIIVSQKQLFIIIFQ